MHTDRSETRSIAIQAPPERVLDLVGDARRLPDWAPAFARTVRAEGEHWRINDEGLIDVRVAREAGTVDLVSAADPRQGAFSRVVANGEGSEYVFTLFFADGTPEADVARQMDEVARELEAVRAACEA